MMSGEILVNKHNHMTLRLDEAGVKCCGMHDKHLTSYSLWSRCNLARALYRDLLFVLIVLFALVAQAQ